MCAVKAVKASPQSTVPNGNLPNARKARASTKAQPTKAQQDAREVLAAYVPYAEDVSKLNTSKAGRVQLASLHSREDKVVKAAKLLREQVPATPVRDYAQSADFAQVVSQRKVAKSAPKVPGSNAQSTIAELEDRVRMMLREGVTTKGGMLKVLRSRDLGANQQRFNRVAEPMIAEHFATPAKSTPRKRTAKATPVKAKASASK